MQSLSHYLVQDVELPYDKFTITSETNNKDLFFEIASFYGKSNLKLIDLPTEEQGSSALADMVRKMYGE